MNLQRTFCLTAATLIFASVLLGCSSGQADNAGAVNIPLIFQPGAKADISYTKEIYTSLETSGTFKATVSMEIIGTNQDEAIISWTLKSVEVDDGLLTEKGPVIEKLFLGVPTTFVAGKNGAPVRLDNKTELIADLTKRALLPEFDDPDFRDMIQIFEVFDEALVGLFFFEIPTLMSICQETDLVIGESKAYQDDFPNIGGGAFPMFSLLKLIVSYELASVNKITQMASIVFTSKFDTEHNQRVMMEGIKETGADPELSQGILNSMFPETEEKANCLVDLKTGWVSKMNYLAKVEHATFTEEKTIEIEVDWY